MYVVLTIIVLHFMKYKSNSLLYKSDRRIRFDSKVIEFSPRTVKIVNYSVNPKLKKPFVIILLITGIYFLIYVRSQLKVYLRRSSERVVQISHYHPTLIEIVGGYIYL